MKAVRAKIAVVGAGIYGATTALRLRELGHSVHLFDPLGLLRAASAINQYRVHAGYHYPRSPETIAEIGEARGEFARAFAPAIVKNSRHYYAVPRENSRTPPDEYEIVMRKHGLPLRACRPQWMNFRFIERCYEVNEDIYDPDVLRSLIQRRLKRGAIPLRKREFVPQMRGDYDHVVWATYGLGPSKGFFKAAKYQVAEKMLVQLPPKLRGVALVVVDGPFTAFDPYGSSSRSLFGSAKNTNHWSTTNAQERIPEPYASMLNKPRFERVPFTRFETMRLDASLAVPAAKEAEYIGSRFTIRVVEDSPEHDRRILHVHNGAPGEIHIFSGKVVSAVKAARLVCEMIAGERHA
ncbi:MAG TPA: FAD-dependent oxidoreductase [Candidatus Acidoferrum sp.]|nr:FAD-dependent oxidoreductase [Candidatus Acidoferrum sp.]